MIFMSLEVLYEHIVPFEGICEVNIILFELEYTVDVFF